MTGRVFDIQRFSIHDGPGIRTAVFFKGCPLRCAWCHNPESQSPRPQLLFYAHKCTGCGKCAEICADTHTPACTGCGRCAAVCRSGAREISGREISAEEVLKTVLRDKAFYRTSGGGVTFSGGEPLAQPEFLLEIIPRLKAKGVHLAIETSGYASQEVYASVISRMDFVYQDVKHHDSIQFRRWTGGDLAVVLANIAWLRQSGVAHVFRVPLIPGVNDSATDRAAFSSIVGDAPVEYLPYNPAAGAKYPMLGRTFGFML